ncbi:MAG: hypothetical protein QY302_13670 [Anaerolineales bacterium]|nr:MAG: hypothetical protein QY302_13670 [Anaerolineales bacterium]
MTTFDLNILPIHRLNGQESADLPGLLALTPARGAARGREKDNLIVYLMLSGNAVFSEADLAQVNHRAADVFYKTPGSLTSAMRKVAENINAALLERNLSSSGRGQYALGYLVLAALREEKCTLLLSGPAHAVWVGEGQSRHIYDPSLSGKGLGSSQNIQTYLSQIEFHSNDLLVLCGKFPSDWEADLLGERPPASFDATYRKLTYTKGDLHAALIQPQPGRGAITVLHVDVKAARQTTGETDSAPQTTLPPEEQSREEEQSPALRHGSGQASGPQFSDSPILDSSPPSITEEQLDEMADFAAHVLQPSAYAIPPRPEDLTPPLQDQARPATSSSPSTPRSFPPSIPRAKPVEQEIEPVIEEAVTEEEDEETLDEETPIVATASIPHADKPSAHTVATRQMAKVMVGGIQLTRRAGENLGAFFRRFIPRLLPGPESPAPEASQQQMVFMPTYMLAFIALVIPILVGTIAVVIYLSSGQSVQYDEFYRQAQSEATRAISETDPARQRDGWEKSLALLDQAESYRQTEQSSQLRQMAQANLDSLMGVLRLEFVPAFTNGLGSDAQISRMAASESDLYMLEATNGKILHATFTGRSLDLDTTFNCKPGTYAGYQVGTLVDLLALPKVNLASATVLGIDASGNLLYCAPGQVPQVVPLPALPNTNWGRITGIALDSGNLYVLDATARSVWVYVGQESTFVDTPYFYFGNQIPNTIDTAIDIAVSGDDLYLLHTDGHISTCTFSRIAQTPTRCLDPLNFTDPFPAHQGVNIFAQAHFTQMTLTASPNSVLLLLDSENRNIFRFTPRSLELQNQITGFAGSGDPFQAGPVGAMTVSPNYVLYFAIGDQVYFATNLP